MSNNKFIRILIALLWVPVLVSCGERSILREAESLLETNPKAADSILSAMPVPQSRRDRAWYAVLKTQADYKQYKTITSDSLILTATNYYGTHHKNYRSAMAWYSQGCVYSELHDDILAMDAYLKAKDLFPDTLVRYYALTQTGLAQCYMNKSMYGESLFLYSCCHNNAIRNQDSILVSYIDFQIALIKLYKQQYNGLDTVFLRLYRDEKLSRSYRRECLLEMAKYHIWYTCQYDSALFYMDEYKNYIQTPVHGVYYNLKGNIYYRMNLLDEAYSYYSTSIDEKSDIYTLTNSYKNLSEISLSYGDSKKAFEYGKLYTQGLDSIRVLNNANEIAIIKIAHNTEIEKIKRKEFSIKTIIVSSFILMTLILFLWGVYQSHLNTVSRNYIRFCDEVWTTISTPMLPNSSLKDFLSVGKIKYMNSPSHFVLFESVKKKTGINRNLKDAIIHDLNTAFGDTISKILKDYPTLNVREIILCLLNYIDVEKTVICDILNMSDDNYRKVKSRLKDKLQDSYDIFFT